MSEKSSKTFDFSQFVPGFEFLKNLTSPAASGGAGAVPGMPSLSNWVAPTLSVEEVDKRIQELKTVQYWLEQNGHALKATIQALEVQKMTLSTLRGMNVQMEDLANAFARSAGAAAGSVAAKAAPEGDDKPAPAASAARPAPASAPPAEAQADTAQAASAPAAGPKADGAAAVIDPLQWWSALTQQFQQIASSALQEAAKLGTPPAEASNKKADAGGNAPAPAAKAPARKKPARKRAAPKA